MTTIFCPRNGAEKAGPWPESLKFYRIAKTTYVQLYSGVVVGTAYTKLCTETELYKSMMWDPALWHYIT